VGTAKWVLLRGEDPAARFHIAWFGAWIKLFAGHGVDSPARS